MFQFIELIMTFASMPIIDLNNGLSVDLQYLFNKRFLLSSQSRSLRCLTGRSSLWLKNPDSVTTLLSDVAVVTPKQLEEACQQPLIVGTMISMADHRRQVFADRIANKHYLDRDTISKSFRTSCLAERSVMLMRKPRMLGNYLTEIIGRGVSQSNCTNK